MAPRILGMLLAFGSLALSAVALPGDATPASSVTVYPASFFAAAQPPSAFDMLAILPGYAFSESDPDVRGFSGAVGNVRA